VSRLESHHCVLNGLGRAVNNFWVYSRNVVPPLTHTDALFIRATRTQLLPRSARVRESRARRMNFVVARRLDLFRGCQWVHPEAELLTERSVSSCIWLAYSLRSNGIHQSDTRADTERSMSGCASGCTQCFLSADLKEKKYTFDPFR